MVLPNLGKKERGLVLRGEIHAPALWAPQDFITKDVVEMIIVNSQEKINR